ncbi:mitochondrial ribonuclease P catalytic subunit-like isoform X2 [Lineus longissimus]
MQASTLLRIPFIRQGAACFLGRSVIFDNKVVSVISNNTVRMLHERCRTKIARTCHRLSDQSTMRLFHLCRGYRIKDYRQQTLDVKKDFDDKDNEEQTAMLEKISILKLFSRLNSDYLNSLIEKIVSEGDVEMTVQDWEDIDKNIGENFEEKSTFGKYWSTQMMAFFNNQLFMKRAKSLLDYVSIDKAHVSILKHFLDLCRKCDESDVQEDIYRVYDVLNERLDLLDFDTITVIIMALCKTKRWKESLELQRKVETLEKPVASSLSSIARAAVEAADFRTVDTVLHKMGDLCFFPSPFVYTEVIRMKNFETSFDMLLMMLRHMRKNLWYLDESVAKEMKEWFVTKDPKGGSWQVNLTRVNKSGFCEHCNHRMERVHLSDKDFKMLRASFMERSVIGQDVFVNTTPEEIEEFEAFLKKNGPYDIVIDGLNIVHATKHSNYHRLLNVVTQCWQQRWRSLVLIRAHAQKLKVLTKVQQKADVFFAKNLSSDDPFLVYAALHSGKNTYIMSRDELRDHRYLLGEKMANLFKVWQRSHQVVLNNVIMHGPRQGGAWLRFPPKHQVCAQESRDGWHIPYDDRAARVSYESPDTWLCVKRLDANWKM